MTEQQYDDDKPTHRYVRIGYALTPERTLDRARIGRVEHLPADEAKRIVDNNHGQYVTAEDAAAEQEKAAETAEAVGDQADSTEGGKPVVDGSPDGPPITPPNVPGTGTGTKAKPAKAAGLRGQGWGATPPDGTQTTTSTSSGE